MEQVIFTNEKRVKLNFLIATWLVVIFSVLVEVAQIEQYHGDGVSRRILILALPPISLFILIFVMPRIKMWSTNSIEVSENGIVAKSEGKINKYAWDDILRATWRLDTASRGAKLVVEIVPRKVLKNITSPRYYDLPHVDLPADQLVKIIEDSRLKFSEVT
jgi:hypothetical protein